MKQSPAEWIKRNYTPQQLTKTPDITVYLHYIKDTRNKITKTLFTRSIKSLGFVRKSKRIGSRPAKVYVQTDLRACPNCTYCLTCNNSGYVKQS